MITRPTVLVLGAGASYPYRFPLGSELVDQLSDIGPDPSHFVQQKLLRLNPIPQNINPFVRALREARPDSVDVFLETRREFRDIDKAAIAENLLRKESEGGIDATPQQQDWYRYVLNNFLLKKDADHFLSQAAKLTMITFNFDRSFELVRCRDVDGVRRFLLGVLFYQRLTSRELSTGHTPKKGGDGPQGLPIQ